MIINDPKFTKEEEYLLNLEFEKQICLNKITSKFNEKAELMQPTPENALELVSFVMKTVNDELTEIDSKIKQINIDADARRN